MCVVKKKKKKIRKENTTVLDCMRRSCVTFYVLHLLRWRIDIHNLKFITQCEGREFDRIVTFQILQILFCIFF